MKHEMTMESPSPMLLEWVLFCSCGFQRRWKDSELMFGGQDIVRAEIEKHRSEVESSPKPSGDEERK